MKKKTLMMLIPSGVVAGILVLLMFGQVYMRKGVQGNLKTFSSAIGKQVEVRNGVYENNYSYGSVDYLSADSSVAGLKESSPLLLRQDRNSGSWGVSKSVEVEEPLPSDNQGSVIVIQPVLPGIPDADKLIRTATVTLEIEDGRTTYKKIADICKEFNGYLAASRFYKDDQGRQAGAITMRIPKDKFDAALESLSTIGKVENIQTDSKDVSQQYASLKTELDAAMVVYNKMLEALNKRQATIPDAIRMESELTPVLRKVENIKNQIEALNNAVSFTTVEVSFHETQVSVKTLQESTKSLRESLIATGINSIKFVAFALPFAFAALVLLVCLIVMFVVVRNIIKQLSKRG